MKAKELIEKLKEIVDKQGDTDVIVDVQSSDEWVAVEDVVGSDYYLNPNSFDGKRRNRIYIICEE